MYACTHLRVCTDTVPRRYIFWNQRRPASLTSEGVWQKSKGEKKSEESAALDRIKKLAVTAMFSDDALLDELVLKGGNAVALIHKLTLGSPQKTEKIVR